MVWTIVWQGRVALQTSLIEGRGNAVEVALHLMRNGHEILSITSGEDAISFDNVEPLRRGVDRIPVPAPAVLV